MDTSFYSCQYKNTQLFLNRKDFQEEIIRVARNCKEKLFPNYDFYRIPSNWVILKIQLGFKNFPTGFFEKPS